jgi:hypothetical protein
MWRCVTLLGVFMEPGLTRLRFTIMTMRWIAVLLTALPVAALANVTWGSRVVPYLPVPRGAAVILNTGSTNSTGYRIVVQSDGNAEYVMASERARTSVSRALALRFFSDLKAAPLQSVAHAQCMKSASFGTSLFVWWNHERSPDLSCAADAHGRTLAQDARAIEQALDISGSVRQPIVRPLMPGEQHKPLPPSPSATPRT